MVLLLTLTFHFQNINSAKDFLHPEVFCKKEVVKSKIHKKTTTMASFFSKDAGLTELLQAAASVSFQQIHVQNQIQTFISNFVLPISYHWPLSIPLENRKP